MRISIVNKFKWIPSGCIKNHQWKNCQTSIDFIQTLTPNGKFPIPFQSGSCLSTSTWIWMKCYQISDTFACICICRQICMDRDELICFIHSHGRSEDTRQTRSIPSLFIWFVCQWNSSSFYSVMPFRSTSSATQNKFISIGKTSWNNNHRSNNQFTCWLERSRPLRLSKIH